MSYCCDGFLSFLESIPESIDSEKELITFITREISGLADKLGFGRLEMKLHAYPTPFETGSNSLCIVLYQHDSECGTSSVNDTYHDREEAVISFSAYPRKTCEWSAEELSMVHLLTYQLFLLCSRTRLLNRIEKASVTDPLTGVLNTMGFMKHGTLLYEKKRLADYTGLFLNIKSFRYINQRFGFKCGDDAMRKYANRIREQLQPEEYLARLGCDNYALLIHNDHLDSIVEFLQTVRVHVQLEDFINTFDLTSRIGIYAIRPEDTMNEVINRMTVACLLAKSSPLHKVVYFRDAMLERFLHDKEITESFSSAIGSNEFVVYYQPKVSLDSQELCGCEALARWSRNGEIIYPSDFASILEQEGSICVLDFYILENVCQSIRNWLDQGIEPVRISTNFSKIHLHNKNLGKDILRILERYNVDPKYIEIELTETSGYDDFEALSEFINTLKAHGIHTSIDDFGTGYSSLNLLTNLNIDHIKLDKSFIQSEHRSKSDEIVIKTIINMAEDLNMQVVCEGVETEEQANFLKTLRCPIVQGFFFDEPLSHNEFENRLKNGRIYKKFTK